MSSGTVRWPEVGWGAMSKAPNVPSLNASGSIPWGTVTWRIAALPKNFPSQPRLPG